MKFDEKLSKARKANNLSQEQLAEKLNVSRQAISKWESGESYPDMAKIIQLCKILNCSLNDLIDDGVMGEIIEDKKEDKKNYLTDFLDYITKTYNMFIHMTFKSKMKMLLEMLLIIIFLMFVGSLIFLGIDYIVRSFTYSLPYDISSVLERIIDSIIFALLVILGIIILFHLFNIRYLDYYVTISDQNIDEQVVETPIEENKQSSELVSNKNPKIIIRDPKHSSSKFFKALFNVLNILFKILIALIIMPAIALFICGVAIIGFSLIQGGNIFKSLALASFGAIIVLALIIYAVYAYIFKQRQYYKIYIIVFIVGLLLCGVGTGVTVNQCLTLDANNKPIKTIQTTKHLDLDEDEKYGFNMYGLVTYQIVDNFKGVDLIFTHQENSTIDIGFYYAENNPVYYYYPEYDFIKTFNIFLDDIKLNQIRPNYESYNFEVLIKCSQETYDKYFVLPEDDNI